MGMDVIGRNNPNAYFRRNVWGWHPLAMLIQDIAPNIAAACRYWHTNDGDGLDEKHSKKLGALLRQELASGAIASYIARRDKTLLSRPRQTCRICLGTGVRNDDVGRGQRMDELVIDKPSHPRHGQTGWCNACDGIGTQPPIEAHYRLTVKDVEEFAAFLNICGGFQIC